MNNIIYVYHLRACTYTYIVNILAVLYNTLVFSLSDLKLEPSGSSVLNNNCWKFAAASKNLAAYVLDHPVPIFAQAYVCMV